MNKYTSFLFFILVLIPGLLLIWYAHIYINEQEDKERIVLEEIVNSRLKLLDTDIQNYLQDKQQQLGLFLSRISSNKSSVEIPALTDAAFTFNKSGKIEFYFSRTPDIERNEHRGELSGVASGLILKKINDPTILFSDSYYITASEARNALWQRVAVSLRRGWYILDNDKRLIFWLETGTKKILYTLINDEQLKIDLADYLKAKSGPHNNHLITLKDNTDKIIFHQGRIDSARKSGINEEVYLSPPLQNWVLSYTIQRDHAKHLYIKYQAVGFTLLFIICLSFIAFYIYREQKRNSQLSEQKMNFVNQVTHELQTPLTNIRMYSELMRDQLEDEQKEQSKFMKVISEESQRLSRLIDNILNMTRSDSDSLKIKKLEGHIEDIISKCINIFLPRLQDYGFKLDYVYKRYPEVNFDPDAIEQILNNLIGNVLKYAYDGKFLKVEHDYADDKTTIRVIDNGPGIPIKERDEIFSPFYRINNNLDDSGSGLGIGLDIARRLARLHDGDIRLLDQEQGSCFEVVLDTPPVGE